MPKISSRNCMNTSNLQIYVYSCKDGIKSLMKIYKIFISLLIIFLITTYNIKKLYNFHLDYVKVKDENLQWIHVANFHNYLDQ